MIIERLERTPVRLAAATSSECAPHGKVHGLRGERDASVAEKDVDTARVIATRAEASTEGNIGTADRTEVGTVSDSAVGAEIMVVRSRSIPVDQPRMRDVGRELGIRR